MSKHAVRGGDVARLLERFAQLRKKALARTGKVFPFVVIQEAGLDGFWIACFGRGDRKPRRRSCLDHDITSAAASEADGIDSEALVRALLAHKRGEPRIARW